MQELHVGPRQLALGAPRVGRMRRTPPSATGAELRARLAADGYVYLPALFPRGAVLAAQECMTEQMGDVLLEGEERSLLPDAQPKIPWKTGWLQETAEVMRVVEGPELFGTFEKIFDEPAQTFDYKWFRTVGPGGSSAFHFDGIYMNRAGTADQMETGEEIGARQHTVWVPWSDVPIGESGLCVIEGSHNLPGFAGLRENMGKIDINYTDIRGGFQFTDPLEVLAYDSGSRLLTEDFSAGDVVIFGMYTLHGSSINRSSAPGKLRLSCDIRFQPKSDTVDKRHTADGRICRGIDEKNRHPGPHRSMKDALDAWGLARDPIEMPELAGAAARVPKL